MRVEIRPRPAIERRFAIGVGENEILGNFAERGVRREQLRARFMLRRRSREHGGREQSRGEKLRDVVGEAGIFDPADEPLAHDDVRMEIFHYDHRLGAIEVENLGRQSSRVSRLFGQRVIFEPAALQRQRPGFSDETHIGQRLLDDDARSRPFDNEDEIEIAVADLADAPVGRLAAEPFANDRNFGERAGKAQSVNGRVGRHAVSPPDRHFAPCAAARRKH